MQMKETFVTIRGCLVDLFESVGRRRSISLFLRFRIFNFFFLAVMGLEYPLLYFLFILSYFFYFFYFFLAGGAGVGPLENIWIYSYARIHFLQ